MRVAVSGAHRTGKTTLIEQLSGVVAGYATFDEPYRLLEADGYEFSDPPALEDFEQQLQCSLEIIAEAPRRALIDRCPLDFLAYMQAIDPDVAVDSWLDDVREAVEALDLIVMVPIERPDRIVIGRDEHPRLRRRVDELLHTLVLEDSLGFGAEVLEVSGSLDDRIRAVVAALHDHS
ncbi:MAG: ATP-binding protein [Kofleriaceae bacterium]